MKTKIWLFISLFWVMFASEAFSGRDMPSYPTDQASLINSSSTLTQVPILTGKIFTYSSSGDDDYAEWMDVYVEIEGIPNTMKIATFQQDVSKCINRMDNNADWGHVKYVGVIKDGLPGNRWFWQQFDYHVPSRALGRKVRFILKYEWFYNKKRQGWGEHTMDWQVIQGIATPNVSMDWKVVSGKLSLEAKWSGATAGSQMKITAGGKTITVSADKGSAIIDGNFSLAEKTTLKWENYYNFSYNQWDVSQNRTASRTGEITKESNTKPINLSASFDQCSQAVNLNWALAAGERTPISIYRKEGDGIDGLTKLTTLGKDVTTYRDRSVDFDIKNYSYVVATVPSGMDADYFKNYGVYAAVNASTEFKNYQMPIPSVATEGSYCRVRWASIPNLCNTSDTKLQLIIDRSNDQPQKVIDLELGDLTYLDQTVIACTSYQYRLKLTFKGKTFTSRSPGIFLLQDAPKITSFKVTKGVYNSKVVLTLESDKPKLVNQYILYRRNLKDLKGDFQKIEQRTDLSARVVFTDAEAIPGTFYEYRVDAESLCGQGNSVLVSAYDLGYAQPYGAVSGRIQYKGGTSVGDVTVRLKKINADEIIEEPYRSLRLEGNGKATATFATNHTCANKNFTFQCFMRPEVLLTPQEAVVTMGNELKIWRQDALGNLYIKVGNAQKILDISAYQSKFFQLTVTAASDSVRFYIDGLPKGGMPASRGTCSNPTQFVIGATENGFNGYIDEVRLWKKVLKPDEVKKTAQIYLSGTETDLTAYWTFDEDLTTHFFDIAHKDLTYYENHGVIAGALPSKTVPTDNQIALQSYTDKNGNYIIRGIPYAFEGSTYQLVPSYGTHQFEPAQQIRYIGGGGLSVINSIDFSDISSFTVTGQINFKDTQYPVEGVAIYMDGEAIVKDGRLAMTDAEGRYEVAVPIGKHFLEPRMANHTFSIGRFPISNDPTAKFDFQTDRSNINFEDNTLVKFSGRIAGGAVQQAFPLGFGLSKANIGTGKIVLNPIKTNFYINSPDSVARKQQNMIAGKASTTVFDRKEVVITTSNETGEFEALIPPITYNVASVSAAGKGGKYFIAADQLTPIDAIPGINLEEEYTDKDGVKSTYPYQVKRIYSYIENQPTLKVTQFGSLITEAFGDTTKIITQNSTQSEKLIEDTLHLYVKKEYLDTEDGNKPTGEFYVDYLLGKPVFNMMTPYTFKIDAWEEYYDDNNQLDRLPFKSGKLLVQNGFAREGTTTETLELPLDTTGVTIYEFMGGLPNLVGDAQDAAKSYVNTLQVTLQTNAGTTVNWLEKPMEGYLFGSQMLGNDFVTSGPDLVSFILRDPPGSGSSAQWTKGSSVTGTFSMGADVSTESATEMKMKLGTELNIGMGLMTKTVVKADATTGTTFSTKLSSDSEFEWTTAVERSYSTSDDPAWIGADADVYIGSGTNLSYGLAQTLSLYDVNAFQQTDKQDGVTTPDKKYKMGIRPGFSMGLSYGTTFAYTQSHIVNTLIPNLIRLRDRFLEYSATPESFTGTVTKARYLTKYRPGDAEYGRPNIDRIFTPRKYVDFKKGPSYWVYFPDTKKGGKSSIDSVSYYNNQIDGWINLVKMNEKEKVEHEGKATNHSFSAGTSISESTTSTETTSTTFSFELQLESAFTTEAEGSINETGVEASKSLTFAAGARTGGGAGTENSSSVSFTLADADENNYHSIDVFPVKGADRGPIFLKKGGRTSCPYEGAATTLYFSPGTELDKSTVKLENPSISVAQAVISDVPGGSDAPFEITMGNTSEAKSAVSYKLYVDDVTNPLGAIVLIDGTPLTGDGRTFTLEEGVALKKSVAIRQSRTDVHEFRNIRLVMESVCGGESASVDLSAIFTPSSSNVAAEITDKQSIVNIPSGTIVPIRVSQLQLNYRNFALVTLQYKAKNATVWNTITNYAANETVLNRLTGDKHLLTTSSFTHNWEAKDLPDGVYQLRVKTVSQTEAGAFVAENISPVFEFLKDVTSPKEIGKPQPATGILTPSENIMLNFNEDINTPFVNRFNIKVQGELNGYKVKQNVGLELAGGADCATTEANLNLSGKSWTLELWTKRVINQEGVVFSHGNAEEAMDIYFTADNYLHVRIKDKDVKSLIPLIDDTWINLSFTYDNQNQTLSAYVMSNLVAEADKAIIKEVKVGEYPYLDKVRVGGSLLKASALAHYAGYVNEMRIWGSKRNVNDITASVSLGLSGLEHGLLAYWPMSEGRGSYTKDLVGQKNLLLSNSWYIYPKGYAAQFNGTDNTVKFSEALTITPDNSYTIELWFRGEPQTNTNLYTYSTITRGAVKKDSVLLSIGFDDAGRLAVYAIGQKYICGANSPLDNQWHHVALVVNRASNAYLYLDGENRMSTISTNFPALMNGKGYLGAESLTQSLYKGSIDEFRIWLSALSQNQLEINTNSRLVGNETGLAAYYPFDRYTAASGTLEVSTTFDDLMTNKIYANGGSATITGSNNTTAVSAPIKDVRPKEDVLFNYTVSDRSIAIDVIEPIERIENTILELSVDNVPDMYNNLQTSPIKWTVFVNLNTMKWKEKVIDRLIKPFEKTTFTAEITNTSGNKQNYSISNIPEWITLSESSGILQPLESKVLTFTIASSLNIGRYEEILYLQGGLNVTSQLVLKVKVEGEKPAWSVDPLKYTNSMNLIGQLAIEGIYTNDIEDILGVFVGDECIGLASPEYLPAQDSYMLFLTMYNNKAAGVPVELRVWDASTGRIYPTVLPNDIQFTADASMGTIAAPVSINALDEVQLDLNLNKGWNWVSTNVLDPQLGQVDKLFEPVKNSLDQIKGINSSLIYDSNFGEWMGDINEKGGFKVGASLKVKMNNPGTVKLIGKSVSAPNTSIALNTGWSWLGFTPSIVAPINTALATLPAEDNDLIKSQKGFAMYYAANGGWIGSLKYLRPGEGYMINMKNGKNFTYPTLKSSSRSKVARSIADSVTTHWDNKVINRYETSMSIVASLAAKNILFAGENYEVAAFVGEECRGVGVLAGNSYFISVNADNNEVLQFKVYDATTRNIYKVEQTITYKAEAIVGNLTTPFQFSVMGITLSMDDAAAEVVIYPTITKDWLNIKSGTAQIKAVTLIDILGKIIYSATGEDNMRIDMSTFEAGAYILVVETENGEIKETVIKQ